MNIRFFLIFDTAKILLLSFWVNQFEIEKKLTEYITYMGHTPGGKKRIANILNELYKILK